ncbi:MAG TPA: hypothetical protein VF765_12135 [Polyangiaceae bacterium]
MRLFLGFSTAAALIGAVASGCSSSSSSPSAPQDSGPGDATMEAMPQPEAAPETGPDVVEEAVSDVCVPDTSLQSLQIPDAALSDSGATIAGCLACVEQTCPQIASECNASCACLADFQAFAICMSKPAATLLTCLSSLGSLPSVGVDASAIACAAPCLTACGQSLPTGDGGHSEGGEDGGTEAGGD